jgi:hypothetical protein
MKRMSDGSASGGNHFRVVMEFLEEAITPDTWAELAQTLGTYLGNEAKLPTLNLS